MIVVRLFIEVANFCLLELFTWVMFKFYGAGLFNS